MKPPRPPKLYVGNYTIVPNTAGDRFTLRDRRTAKDIVENSTPLVFASLATAHTWCRENPKREPQR